MRRAHLIFDGFGRTEAESALNGHTYQFHGVCQYTSYGYTETTRRHTTDDWKPFMRKVHSDAERAGHGPKVFIVDAGSDLVALKSWCESELKVKFIIAPRQHHEFVAEGDEVSDPVERHEQVVRDGGAYSITSDADWCMERATSKRRYVARDGGAEHALDRSSGCPRIASSVQASASSTSIMILPRSSRLCRCVRGSASSDQLNVSDALARGESVLGRVSAPCLQPMSSRLHRCSFLPRAGGKGGR